MEPSPDPADVSRRDIESFVRFRLERVKPATVSADFRALQQFFKWLVREEEIEKNPLLEPIRDQRTVWARPVVRNQLDFLAVTLRHQPQQIELRNRPGGDMIDAMQLRTRDHDVPDEVSEHDGRES